MKYKTTAVFDFDGTILSKMTAYAFYKWVIQKSPIRIIFFFITLPLTLLLITNSLTRIYGLNIISYIATALHSKNLFQLRREFIPHLFTKTGVITFNSALTKIDMHQKRGDKVIIISGCPLWLLHGVTKYIGIKNVELIGSELKLFFTGLYFKKHCFSSNKLLMAEAIGLDIKMWNYGYSDSTSDIPWLKHCKQVYGINLSKKSLEKFKQLIPGKIYNLKWI